MNSSPNPFAPPSETNDSHEDGGATGQRVEGAVRVAAVMAAMTTLGFSLVMALLLSPLAGIVCAGISVAMLLLHFRGRPNRGR